MDKNMNTSSLAMSAPMIIINEIGLCLAQLNNFVLKGGAACRTKKPHRSRIFVSSMD